MQGWVKLHRQLLQWEWYTDANVSRLFIHCLLRANHKDGSWKGINVKRGQFITSLDRLSAETSLSKSQLRTALKKLKSTREIAHESTSQHTVITVNCYDSYQGDDTQSDTPVTFKSQTDDIQIASNKKDKNVNKKDMSDSGESNQQKKADNVPYQKIADLYKSILVDTDECGMSLINMQTLTAKRKTAIKKYWIREGKHGLDRVEQYFTWLWNNRSDHSWVFGAQGGNWKADIEYLLREETIAKAREQRLGNFGGNQ